MIKKYFFIITASFAILAACALPAPALSGGKIGTKARATGDEPSSGGSRASKSKNKSGDAIAIMGMFTPLRFDRGALDDYIPADWELEFFSKERTGLHLLMQDLFTTLLSEESEDLKVIDPATFERLSMTIYRKTYVSYGTDPNARFLWPSVAEFCKLLNVRYALMGDITKIEGLAGNGTVNLEMFIYIYDNKTQALIFSQQFTNASNMAEEYGYNTLRRMHRGASPETLEFMRTDLGRAAMYIFDDFLNKMEAMDGTAVTPITPGTPQPGTDTPVAIPPRTAPGHEDDNKPKPGRVRTEFESTRKCNGSGESIILTASGGAARLSCSGKIITVQQIEEGLFENADGVPWPAAGQFMTRGQGMLALAPSDENKADAEIYAPRGNEYNFVSPAAEISARGDGFGRGAAIAAGDFDGDGRDDLAIVSSLNGNSIIYGFDPGGNAEIRQEIDNPFDGYDGPVNPAAGDFNGDGVEELVLCRAEGGDAFVILKSINGKLLASNPYASISDVFRDYSGGCAAGAGDFDGDGKDELAISKTSDANDLTIFRNARGRMTSSDEIFSAMGTGVTSGGVFPAAGDIDGDGKDELIITQLTGGNGARILKYTNRRIDSLNPMAEIFDVFPGADGMLAAAGPFTPLVRR